MVEIWAPFDIDMTDSKISWAEFDYLPKMNIEKLSRNIPLFKFFPNFHIEKKTIGQEWKRSSETCYKYCFW